MRLLNAHTLDFKTFFDKDCPKYAILSHRWTGEETTLQEFKAHTGLLLDKEHEPAVQEIIQQCQNLHGQCLEKRRGFACGCSACLKEKWVTWESKSCDVFTDYHKKVSELTTELRRHCSPGIAKIWCFCKLAGFNDYDWVWVDTCCIDKSSSAELTEAINSMFSWYAGSGQCYAYLDDVADPSNVSFRWTILGQERQVKLNGEEAVSRWGEQFRKSKWFTRGWTLQELLAPRSLIFYDVQWKLLGARDEDHVGPVVSEITHIEKNCFGHVRFLRSFTVAERMSWMSSRQTSRVEDMAYCMLGIFDIHMPLIYGEGWNAFRRLQEEIVARSPDESIFCWKSAAYHAYTGVMATRPEQFSWLLNESLCIEEWFDRAPHRVTNKGLELEVYQPLDVEGSVFEGYEQLGRRREPPDLQSYYQMVTQREISTLLIPLNVKLKNGGHLCLSLSDWDWDLWVRAKDWRRAKPDSLIEIRRQDLKIRSGQWQRGQWQRFTIFLKTWVK